MRAQKIYDGAYRITDMFGDAMFLTEGERGALLIDTGNGSGDLLKTVRRLTDREVTVCNTHGHMGQTGGNGLFGRVYQDEAEAATCAFHSDPANRRALMLKNLGLGGRLLVRLPGIKRLAEKITDIRPMVLEQMPESFDLGDRIIEVIKTPGHSPGSVCLLDRRYGILYTGDTVNSTGVMLNWDDSMSVAGYRESIQKLIELREKGVFDTLIPSRGLKALIPQYLYDFRSLCDGILSGEVKGRIAASPAGRGYRYSLGTASLILKE